MESLVIWYAAAGVSLAVFAVYAAELRAGSAVEYAGLAVAALLLIVAWPDRQSLL